MRSSSYYYSVSIFSDPFSSKGNVARSVCNTRVFEYIHDCFLKTYLYFGLPRVRDAVFTHQHPSSKVTTPSLHNDRTTEKESNKTEIAQKCSDSIDKHMVTGIPNSDAEVQNVKYVDSPESSNIEKSNQEEAVTSNATSVFVDELVSSTVNTAVDFAEKKKHDLENAFGVNSRNTSNDSNILERELSSTNAKEPSEFPVISQSNQDINDCADDFTNLLINDVSSELETTSDSLETVAKEDICDNAISVVSDSDDALIKAGDSETNAICDNRSDDVTSMEDDDKPVDESQQNEDGRDTADNLSDTCSAYSDDVVVEESDSSEDESDYFYQFLPDTLSDGKVR